MKQYPEKHALKIIFGISLFTMIATLYFSYFGDIVANIISGHLFNPLNALQPCTLCRYQRIALYPIVFLSGLAILKKDYNIVYYTTPLAFIGSFFALYQYALERKRISESEICGTNPIVPCDGIPVEYLGFITLPLMSFIIFVTLIIIGYIIMQHQKKQ